MSRLRQFPHLGLAFDLPMRSLHEHRFFGPDGVVGVGSPASGVGSGVDAANPYANTPSQQAQEDAVTAAQAIAAYANAGGGATAPGASGHSGGGPIGGFALGSVGSAEGAIGGLGGNFISGLLSYLQSIGASTGVIIAAM